MTDYNTDQWTIIQYPSGAGGKLIAAFLFLFDKVEHWYGITDPKEQLIFYQNCLGQDRAWIDKELNQDWQLDFFSRSYTRNNTLTSAEFNQLADDQGSQHFKNTWNRGSTVVDLWYKPCMPAWWINANTVVINPDDYEMLKKLLLKKIIDIDYSKKKATSLVDDPRLVGANNNKANVLKYQNAYEFYYDDLDTWLKEFLMTKPWYSSWKQPNVQITGTWVLQLSDLMHFDKITPMIESMEEYYKQKLDRNLLRQFHNCWKDHSFD
jgi:hypothetical protein